MDIFNLYQTNSRICDLCMESRTRCLPYCKTRASSAARFTRRLLWCEKLSYDKRLKLISVPTLYTRRKYIDLIVAFKTLHGCLDINLVSIGLVLSTLPNRGYGSNVIFNDTKFLFNCIQGFCKISLFDIGISLQQGITRGANERLIMPRANYNRVRSLFRFRAPREWNSLPTGILSEAIIGQFSKAVKNHFKVNVCY